LRQALAKAQFARTLPGSPHGYNQFFTYNTSFEGAGCWQVALTKESGHWQVSGYRFRRRQKNDKQDMTHWAKPSDGLPFPPIMALFGGSRHKQTLGWTIV
jgi:hypothetical protein